jgi:hypothetical protein
VASAAFGVGQSYMPFERLKEQIGGVVYEATLGQSYRPAERLNEQMGSVV